MTALVIGAGVSGRAAAALLKSHGDRVVVYDAAPEAVIGIDADVVHGGAWTPQLLDGIDLVVASPGVPEDAAPIKDALAASLPLWSELELGYRNVTVPIMAVTATNGKTTITELAAEMLAESGVRSAAVGNIGVALSGVDDADLDVLVVEASSFQLRFVETFHASAAVLLNVAPDHLDWHGTFERYAAAKARVLERQTADDVAIFDADDPGAVAAMTAARGRPVPVSGWRDPSGGWGVAAGVLRVGGARVPVTEMARPDAAYVVDVAAAAAGALHLGANSAAIERVARRYQPKAHRRQLVGMWDGISWVDDSKATNPHAAVTAIRAYPSVVLIAGGLAKGLDISPLALEPNLRGVIAIGAAAPVLVAASDRTVVAATIEDAVALADGLAQPGDTVLLAPGCASFDMFRSYNDRGERFAAAVLHRKGA